MLKARQEQNSLIDANLPYLTVKALEERQRIEKDIADEGFRRRQQEIDDSTKLLEITKKQLDLKIAAAAAEGINIGPDEEKAYNDTVARLNNLQKALNINRQNFDIRQRQAVVDNKLAEYNQTLEIQNKLTEQGIKLEMTKINNQELVLKARQDLHLLTPQEIQDQQKSIDYNKIEQETRQATLAETYRYYKEKADLDTKAAKATQENNMEELEGIKKAQDANNTYYTQELENIKLTNKGKKDAADLTYSLSDRQKNYNDAFIKMFDSMGDAIIDFVNKGKGNFSDLIDSFIKDIARYELRLFLFQQYNQYIRPGLGLSPASGIGTNAQGTTGGMSNPFGGFSLSNIFGSFGGMSSTGASGYSDMSTFTAQLAAGGLAKGGAFDQGQRKYAKGGAFDAGYDIHPFAMGAAFTNTVVSEPTLFKFAQGTGLMGEAGPEAIMPLTRDSSGNLGVRSNNDSSGSQVNIVINNNTGAQVKTNETNDGRGTRNIEVVIGDMVAQQIASKNSGVQQSLNAVYGTRPALTRR